jgi:hypothetical protein
MVAAFDYFQGNKLQNLPEHESISMTGYGEGLQLACLLHEPAYSTKALCASKRRLSMLLTEVQHEHHMSLCRTNKALVIKP